MDGIWPEINLSPYLFTLTDNPGINRGIWGIKKYFAASSESLLYIRAIYCVQFLPSLSLSLYF